MGLADILCRPGGGPDGPAEDLDWPWWLPFGSAVAAVVTGVKIAADHDTLAPPTPELLVVLLAVSPWVVQNLSGRMLPRPLFAAAVIGAAMGLLPNAVEIDFTPFLLVMVAAEVAATSSLPLAAAVTSAGAAVMVLAALSGFDGSALWIAGIIAAGAMGAAMQSRLHLLRQERQEGAQRAEQAAVAERQRIAREIHDVIAHSLSVTMLHVTGTRHLLETEGDVDEAVASLRDAERLGRQAMLDIRRTVGLLGSGNGATDTTPMPGLVDIDELVTGFRAAGLDVRYQLTGDPAGPSLATGLGLYRITQESLANVAKHAPGTAVDVCLDVAGDPLRLTVRNSLPGRGDRSGDAAGSPPAIAVAAPERNGAGTETQFAGGTGGLGLHGMQQRAALLGGECTAGLGDDGDGQVWQVEVVVPVGADTAGTNGAS